MKKLTKLLALVLACFMLVPLMLACDDEKKENEPKDPFLEMSEVDKAFHILNIDIDDSMSILAEMKMNLSCKFMGVDVTANIASDKTTIDKAGEGYIDYTETQMAMTVNGQANITTTTNGYVDGKMFESVSAAGAQQGLWSPISKSDYIKYLEENNESSDVENFGLKKENCQSVTCVQDEYGNWTATFTDVSEDGLAEFKSLIESFGGIVDPSNLIDVVLTLKVSENRLPVNMTVDFEFSGENAPTLTMDIDITVGSGVKTPTVDLTGYTEVEDLRKTEN